jgi:hypothetical protein
MARRNRRALAPEVEAAVMAAAGKVTTINPAALPLAPQPAALTLPPKGRGKPGRSKYRNVKTQVDGRTFDSKKEARRYMELRDEQRAGAISGLRCQVPYALRVAGELICRYRADFTYVRGGRFVVEDVKGKITDMYRVKARLMKAIHGIEILET